MKSEWEFAEGDEIAPGLSAVRLLGGGSRYEAYLAWHDGLHSLVVAKVVRPDLVEDERAIEGLRKEAELIERLAHPVIVRGFGADVDGPQPHLVLEHLEGPRLSSLVNRYDRLLPEQFVPLALQVASAVHYLGNEGVVHLDIKPSNIIMGGPPRLIDLSVALEVAECAGITSKVGTDSWMSPEQCDPQGPFAVGPASDIWGLGASLYFAISGERPFPPIDDEADISDLAARWPQLVMPPLPLKRQLPAEVTAPVFACLERNPADRPTPAELSERLETVLEGLPKPSISRLKPRSRPAAHQT